MKYAFIVILTHLLIFATPLSQVLAAKPQADESLERRLYARSYDRGETLGRQAADSCSVPSVWVAGGLLSGMFLGPVGIATVAIISQSSRPAIPSLYTTLMKDEHMACQEGFVAGYGSVMQRKALTNTIIAGAVGTAVLATVVLAYFGAQAASFHGM